ncbi:PREDICTED: ceruloplasmin-like, partial [Nanorana parkeri]|uniref:ceruloplasmin-like n=1 Tax=Nanorana parkeri TaxID=125878 RepID=UPI0008544001
MDRLAVLESYGCGQSEWDPVGAVRHFEWYSSGRYSTGSPLIFLLSLDPLLRTIQTSPDISGLESKAGHQKVAAYADDLLHYVSNPEISLPNLLQALETYGRLSNFKLNLSKSKAVNISIPASRLRGLQRSFQFKWASSHITYLGVSIPADIKDTFALNFIPIQKRIFSDLKSWDRSTFTWMGRNSILKMTILPRLLYLFQTLPIIVPDMYLRQMRSLFLAFLWANKRARLRHQILSRPRAAVYLFSYFYVGGAAGINREFWIAIQEKTWDYAPSGFNKISGKPIDVDEHASTYLRQDSNRIGRKYKKALYIEYTNGSYMEEKKKPSWQGIVGPIMRAEIGDNITIHLLNNASRAYGFHPHGVRYTKGNEGAFYPDNTSGNDKNDDHVQPGMLQTYRWEVVEDQGPTEWDDDCITRIYHSHYESPREIYSGLVGTLIICKRGVLEKKKKKTEEYVLMLSVIDENLSWYIDDNINSYCTDPASVDKEDEGFTESNLKYSINGYMFGNLPGLSVCDNTYVMWYIFTVGNEIDVHSIYFYGHVLTYQHRRVDTISLLPASMLQASMLTQNPGKWLATSQVNEHLEGGMQAIYEVRNCSKLGPPSQYQSTVRRYYIAALEIIWNYGPTSINQFTGQKLDAPGSDSAKYFEQNDLRIGGSYMKAVYREFTDSTFTKEKPRSQNEIHLGILGPVFRAQVGDTIEVIFKNNARHPYSIQVHGVSHGKDMEGAVYKTGFITTGQNGQSRPSHVAPGDTVTYQWKVPDSVAPTSEDLNCIAWLYYSSVDPVKDTNSGLVGPLLVCNKLTSTNQTGADYDFVMMPTVFDENKSWYLQDNINRFAGNPESVDVNDPDFVESNNMHSINGYMYGNQYGLDLCVGSTARWHFLGLGSVIDIHGIHFTGNTIQINKNTRDVVSITPHVSYSAVMTPDNEGVFNVECMTADHYTSGMRQHYRVNACGKLIAKESPAFRTVTYYIAAEEIEWNYCPDRTWDYTMHPDSSN